MTLADEDRGGVPAWTDASPHRVVTLVNVGDSIATGRWGIRRTADHYIARLAARVAERTGWSAHEALCLRRRTPPPSELYGTVGEALPIEPLVPERVAWFTSGIGATRSRDLAAWLERDGGRGFDAYAALDPSLLVVEIGVNDSIHADEEPIDDLLRRYREIVGGLVNRGLRVALVGAVPVRSDHQPGPWRVEDAYERVFRPVAVEFAVPLLETFDRWQNYEAAHGRGFIEDQVHPSAVGHADLAIALDQLLTAESASTTRIGTRPAGA